MVKNIKNIKETYSSNSAFFIDTNILVFLHGGFTYTSKHLLYKINKNSDFIQKLIRYKCKLYVSALNVQEVFHAMESMHYSEYCRKNGECSKKQYRSYVNERNFLSYVHKSIWAQLSVYEIIEETVNESKISKFIDSYKRHQYEPIDFFVSMHAPMNVITDDKDFTKDSNITVYTFM